MDWFSILELAAGIVLVVQGSITDVTASNHPFVAVVLFRIVPVLCGLAFSFAAVVRLFT